MKIYTKRGDSGDSDLLGGVRAKKDDLRFMALGDLDELCAWVGMVRVMLTGAEADFLSQIQEDLGSLMAHVAALGGKDAEKFGFHSLEKELEEHIDLLTKGKAIENCFTRPQTEKAARADLARTAARRAERTLAALSREYPIENALKYVNRLSDYLFALSTTLND